MKERSHWWTSSWSCFYSQTLALQNAGKGKIEKEAQD